MGMPIAAAIELPERYRVTRHIASGGMATVWEAEDLRLGRVVAVKALSARYATDPAARARFQREARTAARVSEHAHIATIYDTGEHGGDAFIVMEYFSGGSVADRLRSARERGQRLPRETALRWLHEAAAALDAAHAAGIVHRDVKPANLLVDEQQRLAVGDFGIARLTDDTHMTQTGQVLGTAAYLSPEQALGRPATGASDRYALAVVAYELLTARRPFVDGPPSAQALQHVDEPPMPPSAVAPDLPPALDAAFARALAKHPSDRPRSAASMVREFERALREPVLPDATQLLETEGAAAAGPRRGISPLLPIGVAATVAAAVVVVLLLAGGGGGHPRGSAAPSTAKATQSASSGGQPAAAKPATTTAPATGTSSAPPATAAGGAGSSDEPGNLNMRGYALSQAGNYADAVPLLQASVDGYRAANRTKELDYAYALFNLAVALTHSGAAADAVPLLEERLTYDNQQATVRRALEQAKAAIGGADVPVTGNRDEQ
ncbi:MAG TPA: serine/threonine-protein kinase [Solirubrobacteraceae bacterium]|jgi:serine/threonine-protein kinase|nr:serine/threonine-protein kinase [Solirubrobacteraceae bacterium]